MLFRSRKKGLINIWTNKNQWCKFQTQESAQHWRESKTKTLNSCHITLLLTASTTLTWRTKRQQFNLLSMLNCWWIFTPYFLKTVIFRVKHRVEQQPTDRLTLGFVYTDQASWLVPYKELLPPKEARKLLNRACELFDSSPRRTVCILTVKIVSLWRKQSLTKRKKSCVL